MIYLFTGNGKGKTSAALGIAVRSICAGLRVAWISWYKNSDWDISEKKLPEILPIDFFLMGKGFYIKNSKLKTQNSKLQLKTKKLFKNGQVSNNSTFSNHKQKAQLALKKAQELLSSQKYNVLILDEINTALADKFLTFSQVKNLLSKKGKTHLILTGRNAPKKLQDLADLVSEIKKIKHPFDFGIKAIKGLDF
jgi:cob(I)alamin adenosyltransferase